MNTNIRKSAHKYKITNIIGKIVLVIIFNAHNLTSNMKSEQEAKTKQLILSKLNKLGKLGNIETEIKNK